MNPGHPSTWIKRLTIVGLVSDDELMEKLVPKGGNAIGLIYGLTTRPSIDLDFSIEDDFPASEIEDIAKRIEQNLRATFDESQLELFDFTFQSMPPRVSDDLARFWGGYRVEFKVIQKQKYRDLRTDRAALRRQAEVVGPRQLRTVKIEISKHEICDGRIPHVLDGFQVYVYTPEMLVAEKLRAICQQFPDYRLTVRSPVGRTGRARDFYDIYTLCSSRSVNILSSQGCELVSRMFQAKHVSWDYLRRLEEMREFHARDWASVQDTVVSDVELNDFDFYFKFVLDMACRLHAFGVKEPPSG